MNFNYKIRNIKIKNFLTKKEKKKIQVIEKSRNGEIFYFLVDKIIKWDKHAYNWSDDPLECESAERTIKWLKDNHQEFFI